MTEASDIGTDPLPPDKAAAKIVKDLLSDLPKERQAKLRRVIEEAISDWGDVTAEPFRD